MKDCQMLGRIANFLLRKTKRSVWSLAVEFPPRLFFFAMFFWFSLGKVGSRSTKTSFFLGKLLVLHSKTRFFPSKACVFHLLFVRVTN